MTCEICNTLSYQTVGEKNGYTLVRCTECGFAYLHPMPGKPEHTCYFNKAVIRRLFGEYGLEMLFSYPMLKASLRVVARKRRSGNG